MISIFLGAGFSNIAGIPLASQLFAKLPIVDRLIRKKIVNNITSLWENWRNKTGGSPEEFLAHLEKKKDTNWLQAVWYVALAITMPLSNIRIIGSKPKIIGHYIYHTTKNKIHEKFWTAIFSRTSEISVITTNYDILIERGLRHEPRPRLFRPGFHYGNGREELIGGGYPSFSHINKIVTAGSVPLIKLHGSISWGLNSGKVIRYNDCRPAIKGNAAIIAPITEKNIPKYFDEIWNQAHNALASSHTWIIVGYSLPTYDISVKNLFSDCSKHNPNVHIFDINPNVFQSFSELLPHCKVNAYKGLPDGISELEEIIDNTLLRK